MTATEHTLLLIAEVLLQEIQDLRFEMKKNTLDIRHRPVRKDLARQTKLEHAESKCAELLESYDSCAGL